MTVREKLNMDIDELTEHGAINIVAFGDSVTHGSLNGTNNYETVYWNLLKKKLNEKRDAVPVNVINAGIAGTNARQGVMRLERDVLCHNPDLVIVCFGLNDVNGEKAEYLSSLKEIFERCKKSGAEVIFLTPNMLNTYSAPDTEERFAEYSHVTAQYQNSGKMDEYIFAAKELAEKCGVPVCDCYSEWKKLAAEGKDTTKLLINRINHPEPKMHYLFADKLFEMIMGDAKVSTEKINTMFRKEKM